MMPSDYAGHLTDAERAQHDRDNATGLRLIVVLALAGLAIFAALIGLFFVIVNSASSAAADPNVETILPADGVTSIEHIGDQWTVTTIAAPSEVKVMSPNLGPVCGTNYATTLGLCTKSTTFTASSACVYVQVDGIPGENSSDPYICLGGTPSATPTPTAPTPVPTGTSSPHPTTTPPVPESTSTPQPTSSPVPTSSATPEAVMPSPSSTANAPSPVAPAAPGQRTLANTGSSTPLPVALAALLIIVAGLTVGSRTGARLFRLSDDGE